MTPGLGYEIVLAVAFAVFYYRIGDQEYRSGILLGGLSIALWLVASFLLGFGWLGCLLVQVGLYVALTIWNLASDCFRK